MTRRCVIYGRAPYYTWYNSPCRLGYTGARCQVKLFFKCEFARERFSARGGLIWNSENIGRSLRATAVRLFFCTHNAAILCGSGSMAPKMPSRQWAKNLFHFVRDARANEKTRAAWKMQPRRRRKHTPGFNSCAYANKINQTEAD